MAKLSGVADVKNRLKGTIYDDLLIGGDLADRLYGAGRRDIIIGGAGDDYINGGDDNDSLRGWAGNDRIIGGNGNDILIGGTGDDTLDGGVGNEYYTVNASEGNDVLIDKDGYQYLFAAFVPDNTSGVFIKKNNDLIIVESTENNISTEIATVQGLGSLAARRAGMRSIVSNLNNSLTIKNYFNGWGVGTMFTDDYSQFTSQIITENVVDYNTGVKVFNQAVTTPSIVRGTGAGDYIVASANGQTLIGGNGNDTYYIDAKTDVIIQDTGGTDSIVFDDNNGGVGGTYVYTKDKNDLKITFDDGSGAVVASATIKNFYLRNGAQIDIVGAADDGTGQVNDAANLDALCNKISAISGADRVLRGTVTDDRFTIDADQRAFGQRGDDDYTVTAGNNIIVDNTGDDDYDITTVSTRITDYAGKDVYTIAAGQVTVYDRGNSYDQLTASGIANGRASFIRKGNDLIMLDGEDFVDGVGAPTIETELAAILGLATRSERRTRLNNILDNAANIITIKNYFSNGYIRTVKDAGATVNQADIMAGLVDYNTGLLASAKGAGRARLNGTGGADYFLASVDGQKLYGGKGTDVYAIPGGMTDVEIHDINGGYDIIRFTDADFDGADSYEYSRVGDDFKISVTDAVDGDSSVLIKNLYKKDYITSGSEIKILEDWDKGVTEYIANYYEWGTTGNDSIIGIIEAYGNDGDDLIYGTDQGDRLYGEAGNDTLCGNGYDQSDDLYGGEGSDVYEVLSGSPGGRIFEEDNDATPDTDRVIFKGVDFGSSSTSFIFRRTGNELRFSVDEGNGVIMSDLRLIDYYAGGTSQVETLEDDLGNVYDLTTDTVSAGFNASITFREHTSVTAPNIATKIEGTTGADNFGGGTGNDTIEGGDGVDNIFANDGDDYIDGGAGDDGNLDGGNGSDTIIGGLGDDAISPGLWSDGALDVLLYNLDDGTAGGADIVAGFWTTEDVVRFTTSATGPMSTYYRDQIAIWAAADAGNTNLEIGYGWDEASQDYVNKITLMFYDTDSATDAAVIEFVTGDTTYTLTDTEIGILLDEIVTGDTSANLAAVHDDGIDGAGQQLQMIAAAW